jgi:hypothetical protein
MRSRTGQRENQRFLRDSGGTWVTFGRSKDDVASLRKPINALQEGQNRIEKELESISKLLTPHETPVPASLDITLRRP